MNRIERGMLEAVEAAALSVRPRYRTGASLYLGNRLVSVGFNSYRTNPKQLVRFRWEHAETNCLIGSSRWSLGRATLYVARVDGTGAVRMARPCPDCQRLLRVAGVGRVWYSGADGRPARLW